MAIGGLYFSASALGLPLVDWLGGPAAFGVVLLLYLWKNTGYSVILLLAALFAIFMFARGHIHL